jgi:SAM-dependent methyltransferase
MQLGEVVNPKFLYKNFQYKTQITSGLKEHFESLSNIIIHSLRIKRSDQILDIGSNDGTFLSNFQDRARVLGIEPGKKIAAYANKHGVKTINAYFNESLGIELKNTYGFFRVIFCANTIANIEDLNEIFDVSKSLLAKNGYFIVETQNGADVIDRFLLDTVYHEHLTYFTYPAFKAFAKKKGFRVDHVRHHEQKGGSLQIWFTHKSNPIALNLENNDERLLVESCTRLKLSNPILVKNNLAKKIKKVRDYLELFKQDKIIGFGASVGTNTLMHLFCSHLKVNLILDDNPTIKELPFGNILLPVIKTINAPKPTDRMKILVFAYRYYDLIVSNHRDLKNRFINIFQAIHK